MEVKELREKMAKLTKKDLIDIAVEQKAVIERLLNTSEGYRELYQEEVLRTAPLASKSSN